MPDPALIERLDQAIDVLLKQDAAPDQSDPELAALIQIAGALREMPSEHFQTELKAELERRASMPATATHIRAGFRTVTPYLRTAQAAEVIEFVKQTFGAEELLRHPTAPNAFHAEVRIGDSMLMIGGGEAARGHARPTALHVYVTDCDEVYRRAIAAGAKSLGEPADHHYGERAGYVEDLAGNQWYIATKLGEVELAPGRGTVTPFMHPARASEFVGFLRQAFGAEEVAHFEDSERVVYAAVRIGDSIVELGEQPKQKQPMLFPTGFYLYVDDADAWHRRALAAGATSLREPADQPYGDRVGGVQDPFGNQWFLASPLGS
jgi:PhnB protein